MWMVLSQGCTPNSQVRATVPGNIAPTRTSPAPTASLVATLITQPTVASTVTPVLRNSYIGWVAFSSARDRERDLYLQSPEGGTLIKMGLSSLGRPVSPAWSPDWQRVTFATNNINEAVYDIYVVDVDCVELPEGCISNIRNLTADDPSINGHPAWSHDGKRIAYASRPNPDPTIPFQIWVMNSDGSNKIQLTDIDGTEPTWSPDDNNIAFTSTFMSDNQFGHVFIMNSDGSNSRRLTDDVYDSFQPSWSPDGLKIAFVSSDGQDLTESDRFTQIYIINVDGTGLTRLTNEEIHGLWPKWSPDGTKIIFQYDGVSGGLYAMNIDGSNPIKITDHSEDSSPAWQP